MNLKSEVTNNNNRLQYLYGESFSLQRDEWGKGVWLARMFWRGMKECELEKENGEGNIINV